MTSIDKSSSPERASKREAGGGGCTPTPNCTYPSNRCVSANVACPSTSSSCCSSRCGYLQPSSNCRSSGSPLKSILKKRNCWCRCSTNSSCMCQPMPRSCNCPLPVQVDARAARECSCECPSSPECACPPSERRFARSTVKCPNARLCRPTPRLPPGPKCCCARCQPPCSPPPCDPCASSVRCSAPSKNPCRPSSPCPSCSSCRPASPAKSPCCPPTSCRKLTFCIDRSGHTGTGQSCSGVADACSEANDVDNDAASEKSDCGSSCTADLVRSEEQLGYPDESHSANPDEGFAGDSTLTTPINSSIVTNPSKSVGPDSPGQSDKAVEFAGESTGPSLEGFTAEKSLKASLSRVTFDAKSPARTKQPDASAPKVSSPRGVVAVRDARSRAHSPNVAETNASVAPIYEIGRKRGGGGSATAEAVDAVGSSRGVRETRRNALKLSSPILERLVSASLRSNRAPTSFLYRASKPPTSVASQSNQR